MKTLCRFLLAAAMAILPCAGYAAATVSNVRGSQRTDGTGIVDIYYDLSGAATTGIVSLVISNDNGANYAILPNIYRLTGDVGPGISNGNDRHIVWDAARDRPEIYWPQCKAKVTVIEAGTGITFTLPGGVLLELIKIPQGSFMMGSSIDGTWSSSGEYPLHQVTINYDYYIGKFEVTQDQWLQVMGSNPSVCSYGCGGNLPVHDVSWNTIQNYIGILNTLGVGGTFRLPSEAEWERAARGGTSSRFPFGDSDCSVSGCTACQLGEYAIYCSGVPGSASAVGTKLPNAFGLYDMLGNVHEFVEDDSHITVGYVGAPTDGSAWIDSPRAGTRILRGGHWLDQAKSCRPAARAGIAPSTTYRSYGFRLAWTP